MIIGYSKDKDIIVAADCLICNRQILLPVTHTINETILCEECRNRLKKQLYGIRELEEND